MWEQMKLADWSVGLRLETERLVLRRCRPSDRDVALEHELDRRIMKDIRDPRPYEEVAAGIDQILLPWTAEDGSWLMLVIEEPAAAGVIGMVMFRVTQHANETFEIGYRLHPDHHGRGFGREAVAKVLDTLFDEVGAHKVVAYCVVENEPSFRLMERLGMQREARLRQHSRLGGRWRDELVYGILSTDPRPRPDR